MAVGRVLMPAMRSWLAVSTIALAATLGCGAPVTKPAVVVPASPTHPSDHGGRSAASSLTASGLQFVVHDTTLVGKGTNPSPLGINPSSIAVHTTSPMFGDGSVGSPIALSFLSFDFRNTGGSLDFGTAASFPGTVAVASTLGVTGAATFSSTIAVTGTSHFSSLATADQGITTGNNISGTGVYPLWATTAHTGTTGDSRIIRVETTSSPTFDVTGQHLTQYGVWSSTNAGISAGANGVDNVGLYGEGVAVTTDTASSNFGVEGRASGAKGAGTGNFAGDFEAVAGSTEPTEVGIYASAKSGATNNYSALLCGDVQLMAVSGSTGGKTCGAAHNSNLDIRGTFSVTGGATFNAGANMASNEITNVHDPVGAQDALTLNYFNTHSAGGGSVTGSGATNSVPVWSSSSVLGSSSISDDGTTVSTLEKGLFGTASQFSASTLYTFGGGVAATTTQVAIVENDTGHVGTGGNNESINLVLRNLTTHDVTSTNATAEGLDINVTASKSAGANSLTNTAILCNASGGDSNYCLKSTAGDISMSASSTDVFGATFTQNLTTSGSLADLSGSTAIRLNQNVTGAGGIPTVEMPGDSTHTPVFLIGTSNSNDGSQLQIKNTNAAGTFNGMEVLADTTVQANQRAGYLLYRGAGGGVGGSNEAGFVTSAASGFPFTGVTANSVSIFNESNQPIFFGADGSAFTYGMAIDRYNHVWAGGATSPTVSSCGTSPSTVTGDDKWAEFTIGSAATGCTMTFNSAYASAPICTVTSQSGKLFSYTVSTSAVTLSNIGDLSSTIMDVHCFGRAGG